jgi:toxin HigB-1
MILSFGDKTTDDIYNGINSKDARKLPPKIYSVATRKLDMINAAQDSMT